MLLQRLQIPKAGALNWVIFLEFDDGVELVFRAPGSSYAAGQGVAGRLLASEAATIQTSESTLSFQYLRFSITGVFPKALEKPLS